MLYDHIPSLILIHKFWIHFLVPKFISNFYAIWFFSGFHSSEPKPVLKKFVCHSFTLNRVNNEWVEIDVRQVIKNWEKMYRAAALHNKGGTVADPMVAIDVEDEYQQPLKAGLFFEPTDCQACKCAVSWNGFFY